MRSKFFMAAVCLLGLAPGVFAGDVTEFETGTLAGTAKVATDLVGYSGSGYVAVAATGGAQVSVQVAKDTTYALVVRYQSPFGPKGFDLVVDGAKSAGTFPLATSWSLDTVLIQRLSAGSHTIAVQDGWGYYDLDNLNLVAMGGTDSGGTGGGSGGGPIDVSNGIPDAQAGKFTDLTDPKATVEAKGLMRFLSSIYGKHVLSGHQASYTWATAEAELVKIKEWTGETPATRGFDFMDVINSWGAPHAANALEWGKTTGGIVQMCWHWRLGGQSFNDAPMPDNPETDATVNADLKKLGDELQKFADAKLPIVWRPLHEPPGKWFWWHNGGADRYKRLWVHMYKYLVQTRGLHNLIWVYSSSDGGTSSTDWYPGNAYVDIIGVDGYGEKWQTYWNGLWSMTGSGKRMQAMTENKKFPPWTTSAPWLWTLGWNNEIFNALGSADFKGHYNHANTLNLDDLPTYGAKTTWDRMIPHTVGIRSTAIMAPAGTAVLLDPQGRVVLSALDAAQVGALRRGTALPGVRPGLYLLRQGALTSRVVVGRGH
ncbi:MAG: hypothetical protein RL318_534 [Fibrobacterota bacterium]|jgi:mannan endo-1,4-beta-mannosidase